jgi:hypothetical protein
MARRRNSPPEAIVVGYDSEWVNAAAVEDELPATDNYVISWQFAVMNPQDEGPIVTEIFYAPNRSKRGRRGLSSMLGAVLSRAVQEGVITEPPGDANWRITVVAHFLRADLTTLRNFPQIKSYVDSVRKTFATTSRQTILPVLGRKASITFVDTMLLSPGGSSLKMLGENIGQPKIVLPEGSYERMDLLLKRDPELFERYALQDAIIAARYYLKVRDVMRNNLGLVKHVPTLGSAGVKMIENTLVGMAWATDDYFGYTRLGKHRHWLPSLTEIVPFASNCYHGGRNEVPHRFVTGRGASLRRRPQGRLRDGSCDDARSGLGVRRRRRISTGWRSSTTHSLSRACASNFLLEPNSRRCQCGPEREA